MLIDVSVLTEELPSLIGMSISDLCDKLAMLGFSVDKIRNVGTNLILDIDVAANRGDVQSHRGLARDLSAKLGFNLSPLLDLDILEKNNSMFDIKIEPKNVVTIYSAAILNLDRLNFDVIPSSTSSILNSMNVSVKNLQSIDASNEILHRYGQPIHVFDANLIYGNIIVRWAKNGEKLVTIDLIERELTNNDLIVADDRGPISMAGLIGGNDTRVSSKTSRILVESAFFDPKIIQSMSYRHNLRTDASHRFSRGVDPGFVTLARNILIRYLQFWGKAQLQSAWTINNMCVTNHEIYLPWSLLDQIAGYTIDHHEAQSLLSKLGCKVYECDDGLVAKAPTWRHDLNIANDLVEEILRLKGYDIILTDMPLLNCVPMQLSHEYNKRRRLVSRLANLGFFQIVTTGFTSPKDSNTNEHPFNRSEFRTLSNPLGEEYSVMRATLLDDLYKVAKMNLERGVKEIKFFEIAPVFNGTCDQITEHWMLGLIWCGKSGGEDPLTVVRDVWLPESQSFFIGILKSIGITDASIKNFNRWHVVDYKNSINEIIGWQFEIPISVISDIDKNVIPKFVPFSKFPIIERDISLMVSSNQRYDILKNIIVTTMKSIGAPLKDVKCVNVFKNKNSFNGKQAWLLRLFFQAEDSNIINEDVDKWMHLVLAKIKTLGAELRG